MISESNLFTSSFILFIRPCHNDYYLQIVPFFVLAVRAVLISLEFFIVFDTTKDFYSLNLFTSLEIFLTSYLELAVIILVLIDNLYNVAVAAIVMLVQKGSYVVFSFITIS